MNEKELYQQKLQSQLTAWSGELDKLKAKAAGATADAKLKMTKEADALERMIGEGKTKLSELTNATDDAWESIKGGVETTWVSLRSAFRDAASKFKD